MTECPSRFTLVRHYKEEINGDEAAALRKHVDACGTCQATIAELKANDDAYSANMDAHASKLSAALKEEPVPLRRPNRTIAVVALAAAAVLLVGFSVAVFPMGGDAPAEVAFKGTFAIQVVAKRGETQFDVANGTSLTAGDALRFTYTADETGFLLMASVDAAGQVSVLYPAPGEGNSDGVLSVAPATNGTLPGSVVLDGSKGTEHVVVIYAAESFSAAGALQGMDSIIAGTPEGLDGALIEVVEIVKE